MRFLWQNGPRCSLTMTQNYFDVYQQKLVIPRQNVENEFENIKNFAGTYNLTWIRLFDVDPDF